MKMKLFTIWDEHEIYESNIEQRKEYWEDYFEEKPSDEEVEKSVYEDEWLISNQWEYLLEDIQELMNWSNRNNYYKNKWKVKVENFGWRNSDEEGTIEADDSQEFLRKILPNTDCTFHVFREGQNTIKIRNWHHDSPMGNEWYEIKPMTIKEVENEMWT